MGDDLNQVGKYVRETRDRTDTALSRIRPHLPKTETVRDVFDYKVPFQMIFNTEKERQETLLHLDFYGPPPIAGCCADCYCSVCEMFVGTYHVITLHREYLPGTVHVFLNNVETNLFAESSPTAGQVTLVDSMSGYIKICYVYKYGGCS